MLNHLLTQKGTKTALHPPSLNTHNQELKRKSHHSQGQKIQAHHAENSRT